ncbi:MAG: UDP-N-acetylglucosamine 2-epimerase (non-hydrolyzing) [Armatimonadetes bacterium]|jgi:UDP-N-acetylglucosamine 2-epimerase|nr:UDP-N-acetylglucosamine 2-epimerase (non-hydrolyzing) [Armatimonadota bacterium]
MNSVKKFKTLAVCGTRPDTVKMAPVVNELMRHKDEADLVLAVTGQHREMLAQVLEAFDLHPDYDLNIMSARQTLAQITTRALAGLDDVIKQTQPQLILAQGDTSTTFIASLAAFYNKIPFGHIEAGLRTDNKYDPYPEEMNRRLTAMMTDLHFAPTELARKNLLAEGISEDDVFVTGNTVIDALLGIAAREYSFSDERISRALESGRMVLLTAHRRENWGEPLKNICRAIREIASRHADVTFIFPMHKNPIVRDTVVPELENIPRVALIEPPDYVPFVHLMKASHLILTDSGGVQEEAPSLGKPVLVLRKTTERPEGVQTGNAKLVGTNTDAIVYEADRLLTDESAYNMMAAAKSPYGDGNAAKRIWEIIRSRYFGNG